MTKRKNSKIAYVGLSGGVDSSVAAVLLKQTGYDVVGVFLKVWQPPFLECSWPADREDAIRVAARLNIPFVTLDLEKEYKKRVVDYFLREYGRGRVPNPDVMCNEYVKFGVFYEKARAAGANFIATGHYARIVGGKLMRGTDKNKDQSYFLWKIEQRQLEHVLFPVGDFTKPQVREIARSFGLPTAERRDSQGLCFLGKIDMKEFLKHYIKARTGRVLDEKGNVIGTHDGAAFYTLGERHGFEIKTKRPRQAAHYVVAKNVRTNTITVATRKTETRFMKREVKLSECNWIGGAPKRKKRYAGQIRYRGELLPCTIRVSAKSTATAVFTRPVPAVPGQSFVLFDREICLGGGIIA